MPVTAYPNGPTNTTQGLLVNPLNGNILPTLNSLPEYLAVNQQDVAQE